MSTRLAPDEVAEYLLAAGRGDGAAWTRIVDSYSGLVWSIVNQHGMSNADASDVSQTVWLRLVENLHRIEDPTRLGGWLATTARRECLRVIADGQRQVPIADATLMIDAQERESVPLDWLLLQQERADEVRAAMAQLPPRCQALLEKLMQDPQPSYAVISATLGTPIGSIGPTRGRCLRQLQRLLDEQTAS
jgi:RNA polymerase sigma factor (sigma-70 family)